MKAAPRLCPCACGSPLTHGRVVCAALWRALPAALREVCITPLTTLEARRAAYREVMNIAKDKAQSRLAAQQLTLFP